MKLSELTDLQAFKAILDRKNAVYTEKYGKHIENGNWVKHTEITQTDEIEWNITYQFDEAGNAINNFNPIVSE